MVYIIPVALDASGIDPGYYGIIVYKLYALGLLCVQVNNKK